MSQPRRDTADPTPAASFLRSKTAGEATPCDRAFNKKGNIADLYSQINNFFFFTKNISYFVAVYKK
ncbi:MAG: hypothetical protein A2167_06300 [Planctomycetes bacterium RBG_13_46_10]|nr:MAG: hypothetical protein A2167_06300 [Planctomycetes bacterium RBG_13_46_10]